MNKELSAFRKEFNRNFKKAFRNNSVPCQWNKLDSEEKKLVVTMFNLQIVPFRGLRDRSNHGDNRGMWFTVEIDCPNLVCEATPESEAIWDAGASITKDGRLRLDGGSGSAAFLIPDPMPKGFKMPKPPTTKHKILPKNVRLIATCNFGS
jgi:hypothetical protein